jgi:hypothetical protein
MQDVGLCYGHLDYFTAIWSRYFGPFGIYLWLFGIFPVLLCCTEKNLATLLPKISEQELHIQ